MNNNSCLKVEIIQQYDIVNQKYTEDRNIKLSTQAIQEGLIKTLGGTELAVLLAISSFCDVEGEAFPSQRTLAELTGYSLPTVNKAVGKLLETKIDGKPIISRELESLGSKKKFSVYSLYVKEEEAVKKKTAKDYTMKFKTLFEEKYGFPLVVNYGRDTGLIKKKLMPDFDEEEIEQIIEYTIEHYTDKWANANYPYPTISMMCSWIANAVVKELIQEKKKADALEKRIENAKESEASSEDKFDLLSSL